MYNSEVLLYIFFAVLPSLAVLFIFVLVVKVHEERRENTLRMLAERKLRKNLISKRKYK